MGDLKGGLAVHGCPNSKAPDRAQQCCAPGTRCWRLGQCQLEADARLLDELGYPSPDGRPWRDYVR
jgi:hypothetical protein